MATRRNKAQILHDKLDNELSKKVLVKESIKMTSDIIDSTLKDPSDYYVKTKVHYDTLLKNVELNYVNKVTINKYTKEGFEVSSKVDYTVNIISYSLRF